MIFVDVRGYGTGTTLSRAFTYCFSTYYFEKGDNKSIIFLPLPIDLSHLASTCPESDMHWTSLLTLLV